MQEPQRLEYVPGIAGLSMPVDNEEPTYQLTAPTVEEEIIRRISNAMREIHDRGVVRIPRTYHSLSHLSI